MTRWAISDIATGDLIATFVSDTHPRFNGFDWKTGEHRATAIDDFDPAQEMWNGSAIVADLPALRARRWDAVRARRDVAEWGGCATPLGRVDTGPDSQRKVGGAVQLAFIAQGAAQPFSIDWTMQDNASVAHDAGAMILLGVAVGQHVAACHAVAVGLRASIEAATDAAAIGAIDIETGWPS